MVAYTSLQKTAPAYPVSGVGLGGRSVHVGRGEYTSTVAITTADTIAMFDLPPRARVVGGFLKATDMDTNGTPTIALNVGIAGTPALFFAASNVAQAGTAANTLAATGYDYTTTAKTPVIITPSTNAATFANGVITLVLEFIVEEPA
jgi:hypothetical protein